MDPGEQQQQDGVKNMTRALEALAPYLKHPRRTVIEIEALLCAAVVFLFLQLFLAPLRRRSGHWFLRGTLWFFYNISLPLMTYTFGQMVTSPVKNVLYPFWSVLLFWAAGCTDVFTAFSLQDHSQWKRYVFDLMQYFFYSVIVYTLLEPQAPRHFSFAIQKNMYVPHTVMLVLCFLTSVVIITNILRIVAAWNARYPVPSKLVADYMRAQVEDMEEPFDPITLKGYKYLVHPIKYKANGTNGSIVVDEAITIKDIWDMTFDDTMLNTDNQGGSQLKLVSLSFALARLLRRRFFGMDCAEAALPATRRFALEGLLAEEDQATHYSTAFHIVEVELGFLYDLYFTKHSVLFQIELPFLFLVLLKFIHATFLGISLLRYFPTILTTNPIIEVGTRRVDVIVTFVIMVSLILLETLQVLLYLTSDWAIVSLALSYTIWDTRLQHARCKPIMSVIQYLRRLLIFSSKKMFGRTKMWQNQMGQSSLIESGLSANSAYVILTFFQSLVFSKKTFQVVPALIRSEIVSCLRKYSNADHPLTNGEAALHLNGVHEELSWSLKNNSQTLVMLIWHVAAEYCIIASSHQEANQVNHRQREEKAKQEDYQQVATTLSRYCAYLMIFIPELLPGNSTDTTYALNDVMLEGIRVLGKGKPSRDDLLDVIANSESGSDNNEGTIFIRGLKLGRDLEKEDVVLRWKVMAEFWAETIIYIAPSDNITAHMERLAHGGEFLTHIWALLAHAGILKRD